MAHLKKTISWQSKFGRGGTNYVWFFFSSKSMRHVPRPSPPMIGSHGRNPFSILKGWLIIKCRVWITTYRFLFMLFAYFFKNKYRE